MAKKIVQYCYFGEDTIAAAYKKVAIDENTFQQKVAQGVLYVYSPQTRLYILLSSDDEYSDGVEYYEQIITKRTNSPTTINKASLISGSIFNNVTPIVKLGIQAIPGTKFRLNANKDWIIMGMTGIYEIDLTHSSATIMKLQFEETSLEIIDKNENAYLIIDIMSEKEGSNT